MIQLPSSDPFRRARLEPPGWASGRWYSFPMLIGGGPTWLDPSPSPPGASKTPVGINPLLWGPSRPTLFGRFSRNSGLSESDRALFELQRIPLSCPSDDWTGAPARVGYDGSGGSERGPRWWVPMCPVCGSIVAPNVENVRQDLIASRWEERGRPRVEPPPALMYGIEPISDVVRWIDEFEPPLFNLVYVGQQLWPSYAEFTAGAFASTRDSK